MYIIYQPTALALNVTILKKKKNSIPHRCARYSLNIKILLTVVHHAWLHTRRHIPFNDNPPYLKPHALDPTRLKYSYARFLMRRVTTGHEIESEVGLCIDQSGESWGRKWGCLFRSCLRSLHWTLVLRDGTRQGTLVHSRLSSPSHCGLIRIFLT